MKLVAMRDFDSRVLGRVGSSPTARARQLERQPTIPMHSG